MEDYISTTEAAKILDVSSVTIFNMIKDGRIKGIKVGRNYIIDRTTLQENFIKDIKEIMLPILKKHGVKRAAIFGSTIRGKTNPKDVDILIEYKRGKNKSLFDFIGLKLELEDELDKKVDLVQFEVIHPMLKEDIINSAVPIL